MGCAIGSLGSCCGSFLGSCLSAGCCAILMSGSTASPKASRCVLAWLQVFTALVVLALATNPTSWLAKPCNWLDYTNAGHIGVCACLDSDGECWQKNLVYRAEGSALVVYLMLIGLVVSGCGEGAAHAYPLMKFFSVLLLILLSFFCPNEIFTGFGILSGVLSAVFLVAQTMVVIDFAYSWNELWVKLARDAQRAHMNSKAYQMWTAAIIATSMLLLLAGTCGMVHVYLTWPGLWWLPAVTLVLSLVFLVVSITDWCEHGALLPSCVVTAYAAWLCYATACLFPREEQVVEGAFMRTMPQWVGLLVCVCSLVSFASMPSTLSGTSSADGPSLLSEVRAPLAAEPPQDGLVARIDAKEYVVQCGVHAAASLYIASAMEPQLNEVIFSVHSVAVITSVLLYGWTLIAPKVLTSREF
eukprot:TRINITY_DN21752_c0_g1_i1.p1 TRINITY_DN21752_c0_g1~~TRINITY_DN21752_c0_g1_i1.p1  ORF type:complete len:414 (+),score=37.73 TRINITY_DN21752_c0_g1_i1:79-1320(+)